jgi:hypothetical protein
MKQQTAVEWLVNELIKYGCIDLPSSPIDGPNRAIHKAKQLERQQIIDAGNNCAARCAVDQFNEEDIEKDFITYGEQYYNETYNQ